MRGVHPTASSLSAPLFLALLLPFLLPSSTHAIDLRGQSTPAQAAIAPPTGFSMPLSGYGPFLLDSRLEPRVRFWVAVFGRYNSWETLIIDERHPSLVLSVVDTRKNAKAAVAARPKVAEILRRIEDARTRDPEGFRARLKPEELRVLEVFERENLLGELGAIARKPQRLRLQPGMRDTMEKALFVSSRYLPPMQKLFARQGLPEELAYLPFVSSGFDKGAVSRGGPSGFWQLLPRSSKLFLRVDEAVDERNDPMRAAEAAAQLLRKSFEELGSWPLAVTAYSHGTAGVARLRKEKPGAEISEIVEGHEGAGFGFASRNFYACFLAALNVAKNSTAYIGEVPRAPRLEFDEFVMPDFMAVSDFTWRMGIDLQVFRELNPALTDDVYSGAKFLPVGYTVRVPQEAREDFLSRYEAIPAGLKRRKQR